MTTGDAQGRSDEPAYSTIVTERIVNLGVELMGRSTMQVLAGVHDTLANPAPEAAQYSQRMREAGVGQAVRERDARFN